MKENAFTHYIRDEEVYSRFKVLESEDMADAIVYMLASPAHMQIHDMLIRPTDQPS